MNSSDDQPYASPAFYRRNESYEAYESHESHGSHDSYAIQGYDIPPLPYIPYAQYDESTTVSSVKTASSPSAVSAFVPVVTDTMSSGLSTPALEQAPDSPHSPKRRRRRLWLSLGIAALLLIIVGGASAFALVSYLNRSTPEKTLKTFCTALQQESYQLAYNQLTANLQSQITEADFASGLAADKIIQCTYGATSEASTTTRTSLKLVHFQQHFVNNDIVTLTKQSDSIWRISDLTVAS